MTSLLHFGGQTQKEFLKEKNLHRTPLYFDTLKSVENLKECQCCFCGVTDGPYLELHHKNGDHEDYSVENLDTICSLCHRTLHLGWAMVDNCCTLGQMSAGYDPDFQEKQIDYALYNLLYRIYFLNRYQGRGLQEFYKKPFYQWFIRLDNFTQSNKGGEVFNKVMGLGDVLMTLDRAGALEQFLKEQRTHDMTRFCLVFNIRAFIPLNPDLTLKSRLDFYAQNPQFQENYFDELIGRQL